MRDRNTTSIPPEEVGKSWDSPSFIIGESFRAMESEFKADLMMAGPNAAGHFVVIGNGGQLVRIPENERLKLAACLMLPFMNPRPTMEDPAALQQLREGQKGMKSRPKGSGGIIARP